jgi:hypothetical protein
MPNTAPAVVVPVRKLGTVAAKKPQYSHDAAAPRAACPDIGEFAYVTRGIHVSSGSDALIVRDGSTYTGLAAVAVGEAITGEVVSLQEIVDLLTPVQCSKLAKLASAKAPAA